MTSNTLTHSVNRLRRAGVLLHPTSLPGYQDNGDMGHQAYRFIEFLHSNRFKVWQMLPLGPTHEDKSPYQCLSAHAGNPKLISLDWLKDKGWLDKKKIETSESDQAYRNVCLQQATDNFYQLNDKSWLNKINDFKSKHNYWLDDYSLFVALKKQHHNKPWYEWPDSVLHRDVDALNSVRKEQHAIIRQTIFEQFVFFTQWHEIRAYAKQHEVELFGDMPIFVATDSVDVWAQRENFLINNDGDMEFIAGVPPDAFSETGQRWGNPLYDWEHMQATQYSWWQQRFETQLDLFDIVRIDHFRGLEACWQIPQKDDTAINGSWIKVPGREMLTELFSGFDCLPLVAEDLGVITAPVIKLKKDFNLPGMKVLQFAFDGNNKNPHLPHCHELDDVVYTGTHDNDTSLGWACNEGNYNKSFYEDYIGMNMKSKEQSVLSLIRMAMSSVSFLTIIPMQDILMLDSASRMNVPGTVGNNWQWRFEWQQLRPEVIEKITHFMSLYQR